MSTEVVSQEYLRAAIVRRGRRLEYHHWLELLKAIISIAPVSLPEHCLVGGIDSVIEVSSGVVLLWRLVSGEHREQLALKLVSVSFFRRLRCDRCNDSLVS
jgi:hypothetical protein